jgi:hypothetical protein
MFVADQFADLITCVSWIGQLLSCNIEDTLSFIPNTIGFLFALQPPGVTHHMSQQLGQLARAQ